MKKLLCLFLIISFSSSVFSQERQAYGRVFEDKTMEPVASASIEVLNTGQKTIADSMGRFFISVPKGENRLMVTHDDFLPHKVLLAPHYWKGPLKIRLSFDKTIVKDSSEVNQTAKKNRKVEILTLQEEFNKCYKKIGKKYKVNKRFKVLFVLNKQGDTVEFNLEYPGRIVDTGVFGFAQIRIPYDSADSTAFNAKSLQSIWKDGVKYEFISQEPSGYICYIPDRITIPLNEIDLLKVKVKDYKPIGYTIIAAGATAAIVSWVVITNDIKNNSESWW